MKTMCYWFSAWDCPLKKKILCLYFKAFILKRCSTHKYAFQWLSLWIISNLTLEIDKETLYMPYYLKNSIEFYGCILVCKNVCIYCSIWALMYGWKEKGILVYYILLNICLSIFLPRPPHLFLPSYLSSFLPSFYILYLHLNEEGKFYLMLNWFLLILHSCAFLYISWNHYQVAKYCWCA